jgi:hypothetical protein
MSSVGSNLAGTASGINNAVSRTAGVLAIAVVGALALILFAHGLSVRVQGTGISEAARLSLSAEASRLGAATVPAEVAAQDVSTIQQAIRLSFVDAFKVVMIVCAALAWAGAVLAGLLVEKKFTAAR